MTGNTGPDGRSNNGTSTWTPDALELVRREAANLSAAQIANRLRADLGIMKTRNAVISVIHRKGWQVSARVKAVTPKPKPRTAGMGLGMKPRLIHTPQTPYQALSSRGRMEPRVSGPDGNDLQVPAVADRPPVGLLDLRAGQCRMVVSAANAPAPLFCGCPCARGPRGRFDAWCAEHKVVAAAPTPKMNTRGMRPAAVKQRRPSLDQIGRRYNGL